MPINYAGFKALLENSKIKKEVEKWSASMVLFIKL